MRYRVSHETWQLVCCLECLLPLCVKLFNTKDNIKKNKESYYSKTRFKSKIYLSK